MADSDEGKMDGKEDEAASSGVVSITPTIAIDSVDEPIRVKILLNYELDVFRGGLIFLIRLPQLSQNH